MLNKRDPTTVTTYHEIGHAIMAMACGCTVTSLSIAPDETSMGRVAFNLPDETDVDWRRRAVLIYAGGFAADMVHWKKWGQGHQSDMLCGHSDDQRRAGIFLAALNEDELFLAYAFFAVRFLSEDAVWQIAEQIADILKVSNTIDGSSLSAQFANICPKIDQFKITELEKFKVLYNAAAQDELA